jgi:hypothetical protein
MLLSTLALLLTADAGKVKVAFTVANVTTSKGERKQLLLLHYF